MIITATELEENLDKYLDLASNEDIFITENEKVIARLSSPHDNRITTRRSLAETVSGDITAEEVRKERLPEDVDTIYDTK